MPARSRRASGRVTPKGTSDRPAPPSKSTPSPHQRAVAERRQVDNGSNGVRSGGRPPSVFRRSGHR
jgi:hypothetical protein